MSLFDDIGGVLDEVFKAITKVFSSAPPPGPVQMCLLPKFEAHIIGVTFMSPVPVARRGKPVTGEHWTEGTDVNEPKIPNASIKAAVVLMDGRGDPRVRLRIRVTKSVAVGPTGPVTGSLGGVQFHSIVQCPTAVGDHAVNAQIIQLHPAVARDAGDASWSMQVDPIGAVALGATRLELVTILDKPPTYYAGGVWIEVLRLLIAKGGLAGFTKKRNAAAACASFAHHALDLGYDIRKGEAHFGANNFGSAAFRLAEVISPGPAPDPVKQQGKVVNCHDMAACLTGLAGSLGVDLRWKHMRPFGFLATTHLIGVPGECNNPFFRGSFTDPNTKVETPTFQGPMAPFDHPLRSSFDNHAFACFFKSLNPDRNGVDDGGVADGIGDSCAGPSVFARTLQQYVFAAVDQNRQIPPRFGIVSKFAAIQAFENGQMAAINALPIAELEKERMRDAVKAFANSARQAVLAELAQAEANDVKDTVGLTGLNFVNYSGP